MLSGRGRDKPEFKLYKEIYFEITKSVPSYLSFIHKYYNLSLLESFEPYSMRNFRLFLYLIVLLVTFSACSSGGDTEVETSPPNIVFILADDLGWADLSCYGSTFYETPNLDRLAAGGMRFTQAYAACPVCSPTRASIVTGKYPARTKVTDWIPGRQNRLPKEPNNRMIAPEFAHQVGLEEVTIAEALKDGGYTTFFAGKWHLGQDSVYWPEHQGFDMNVGGHHRGSPPGGYFSPYENPRLENGPEGEYLTDRLTDESVNFLDTIGSRPFLLYLSFYTVHNPMQGKDSLVAKYREKADSLGYTEVERFSYDEPWIKKAPQRGNFRERLVQDSPVYASMIESMDQNIGKLMDKLEAMGIDENTVIFFTSDNGGLSTSEGSNTTNAPLRAGKGWLYEGGIREPLIVRWPAKIPAGTLSDVPVTSTDYYPTMLEMVGLPQRPEQHMDGVSMMPLLREEGDTRDRAIFWHYPHYANQGGKPGGIIRKGEYKLIEFYEFGDIELYNLAEDIGEENNLARQRPEIVDSLLSELKKWREDVDADMMEPNDIYDPNYERQMLAN